VPHLYGLEAPSFFRALTQDCGLRRKPAILSWAGISAPTAMPAHRGAGLRCDAASAQANVAAASVRQGLAAPRPVLWPSAGITGRNRKPASPDRPGDFVERLARHPTPGTSAERGPRLIRLQLRVQASCHPP
jgi:hypothetical protein